MTTLLIGQPLPLAVCRVPSENARFIESCDRCLEMEERPVELVLRDNSHIERAESKDLRGRALNLVVIANDATDATRLPDTLLDLLTQVLKPLFSKEQHSKLTSTGRKNLVDKTLPAALDRFSSDALFDSEKRPLWKNGWTTSLLKFVLSSYKRLGEQDIRRKTLEAHFHLLIPPILHQIDDIDVLYKAAGCQCLQLLCENLHDVQSGILKRSGLADVFIEALKNDFSLLPTLTPEDESLMLYQALYPAYRDVVRATFPSKTASPPEKSDSISSHTDKDTLKNTSKAKSAMAEEGRRQSYLTLILRHQLLHSLSHLSTGTGGGSTASVSLSTFLISQFRWIFTDMGISSVVHLQNVLPLLRHILSDPFGSASPEMLLESVKALNTVVQTAWPRIREKWWSECLRGVVNCWLNVNDDERDMKDKARRYSLAQVKHELKVVGWLLEDIVGEPFLNASADIISEEPMLKELFHSKM